MQQTFGWKYNFARTCIDTVIINKTKPEINLIPPITPSLSRKGKTKKQFNNCFRKRSFDMSSIST